MFSITLVLEERRENEEISFSITSQSYCMCFVNMLDAIENTCRMKEPDKIRRYYSIFINTMAAIARNFGAKIIKNTGTGLIYFFPKTSLPSSNNLSAFKDVIECGITSVAAKTVINTKLNEEQLPPLHYKISADYGRVEVARSKSSPDNLDLFGSTMNVCAKINSMASPDSMVIGSDLYYIVKRFGNSYSSSYNGQYSFKRIGEYSISTNFKYQYSVYSVSGEVKDVSIDLPRQIPKLQKPNLYVSEEQHTNKYFSNIGAAPVAPQVDRELNSSINHEVYRSHSQQQSVEVKGEQQIKHSPAKVMIVDDELDALLTYKVFLSDDGYNVDAFSDPQEALKSFAQANYYSYCDLVIMDIRMPGLNGLQLYYRIKAINPDVKILFVSALDAAEEMVSILPGINLGDIVRKPVERKQFLFKVKSALG